MSSNAHSFFIATIAKFAAVAILLAATFSTASAAAPCAFDQPFPYPSGSPYVGLHANRENNNRVYCDGPTSAKLEWKALENSLVLQPISIGTVGGSIYATISRFDGCKLYALDASTGEVRWCKDEFTMGVSAGTPEVDLDGNIYVTDGDKEGAWVYSLTPDGEIRWKTSLTAIGNEGAATYFAPAGAHFTPGGYVATVTTNGAVVLLDRKNGDIRSTFFIARATGFVAPAPERQQIKSIPPFARARLEKVIGKLTDEQIDTLMSASKGASGAFSDNTIGVSSQNQLFVIGGGPDPQTGALTALDIVEEADSAALSLRWTMPIKGGSGTSPAISANGNYAAVGDGDSNLVFVDIAACNENKDSDTEPDVCAPAWKFPLKGRSLLGSPGVDEDGVVYFWDSSRKASDPDLLAVKTENGAPKTLWAVSFASGTTNFQWTSAATVMNNIVIGTVSEMKKVSDIGMMLPMIQDVSHEIVAVDRRTGEIVWRQPVDDDSINSLAVGPDGAIYVPEMGIMDLMAQNPDIAYHGGIIKYVAGPLQ